MLLPFDFPFRGAGRAKRFPRIESVAGAYWRDSLERQGSFGYAGDDENPRALPKRTLASMREKMQDWLDAKRDDGTLIPPLGLLVAFCDAAIAPPGPEVIGVPREDLAWLASPGDLLLLSDGVTTHYTTMLATTHGGERLQLVDEWPERVFLRDGFNEADVAARIEPFLGGVFESVVPGRMVIDISCDEFARVAVGLVTYDTPLVLEQLHQHGLERYSEPAAQLVFGCALMAPSYDVLVFDAAPYFARAEAGAIAAGDEALALDAAAWSYAAHAIATLLQDDGAPVHAAAPFAAVLGDLHRRYGEARLLDALDVEVVIRIGNAAAHASQFDVAFAWLSKAIERNPFHDAAHWLRAKVRQYRGGADGDGIVADATEALRRNQAWIDRRIAEHNARDPRDRAGTNDDLGRISGLASRRVEELRIRAVGFMLLGRLDDAEADLAEARKMRLDDAGIDR